MKSLLVAMVICLASNTSVSAESLEDILRDMLVKGIENDVPATAAPAVSECLAVAVVSGMPTTVQERIVSALRMKRIDKSTNELFVRYLGVSPLDGPIMPPDASDPTTFASGKLRYKSGREVRPIGPEQAASIKSVSETRCPELVKQYPKAFRM